ncbi:DUF2975 domain-containing protein [Marivirga harenae]|uniref:DUF2975 domain-containing protein n=1 Tax=Marivirga harenae TaxID=2010992 RepID=UPI0026E0F6BE|nr:DUF2975 domain-containing protein [Marivirga harenae]WKV13418.1 hypothetical protein Q3Y49_06215 [Marivirga harenae]
MKSNLILSISAALMQVARVVIALLAGLIIVMFIGSFVNDTIVLSEFLKSVSLSGTGSGHIVYNLREGNFWVSFFVIIQNLAILIVWFLILGYGKEIMINIKSIRTFAKDNVKAFSRISSLALLLVIIQFIALSPGKIGLKIEFSYVFFAFAAIILTQVFKEGQRLLEENELTV